MSRQVKLCTIEAVTEGEPLQVVVPEHGAVAVYRVEGKFYVTDDLCTHGQASLGSEGDLNGFKITCTWHDGAFDIRTGEVLARPCEKPIGTYLVTVSDGAVWITV